MQRALNPPSGLQNWVNFSLPIAQKDSDGSAENQHTKTIEKSWLLLELYDDEYLLDCYRKDILEC
jgi:hypothetical protein